MRFEVLGPFQARRDAQSPPLPLGGAKQRALLAVLVAAGGRVVSTDQLVDELWADGPPDKVTASIQSYVASLRRTLEPDRTRLWSAVVDPPAVESLADALAPYAGRVAIAGRASACSARSTPASHRCMIVSAMINSPPDTHGTARFSTRPWV